MQINNNNNNNNMEANQKNLDNYSNSEIAISQTITFLKNRFEFSERTEKLIELHLINIANSKKLDIMNQISESK